jgi:hypothetical protein
VSIRITWRVVKNESFSEVVIQWSVVWSEPVPFKQCPGGGDAGGLKSTLWEPLDFIIRRKSSIP